MWTREISRNICQNSFAYLHVYVPGEFVHSEWTPQACNPEKRTAKCSKLKIQHFMKKDFIVQCTIEGFHSFDFYRKKIRKKSTFILNVLFKAGHQARKWPPFTQLFQLCMVSSLKQHSISHRAPLKLLLNHKKQFWKNFEKNFEKKLKKFEKIWKNFEKIQFSSIFCLKFSSIFTLRQPKKSKNSSFFNFFLGINCCVTQRMSVNNVEKFPRRINCLFFKFIR